jgi:hypothetical protein
MTEPVLPDDIPETPSEETRTQNILEAANVETHRAILVSDKKNQKGRDKIVVVLSISAIVEIFLVFGLIVSLNNAQNANNQLKQVQQVVNSQVLCPLYETLKSSESAAARNASSNKAAYDQLVQDIQHSIDVLGCSHP